MSAIVLAAAANNPALPDRLRQRHAARIGQSVASNGNFALATVIMFAVVQQLMQLADQAFGSGVAPEKNQ